MLFAFAVCMFISTGLHAQKFELDIKLQPKKDPLVTTGMLIGAVGIGAVQYGVIYYHFGSSRKTGSDAVTDHNRTFLAIAGAGVGLFAIGGGLVYAGLTKNKKIRWSLVTPKGNEIGIAYNF